MTHHIDHHRSGPIVRHEPTHRRERDGSWSFTDGAVRDIREQAAEKRREGWSTRRSRAAAAARSLRPELGLPA
ncbi:MULTISPECIES: hypothetical protein [unclassified Sphingomonas]|uniref:hypothetical protein n=1 Tax=unclassified Sphingomonas TaxID=196159 RepID=UPI0006F92633|nr:MULTISPECIES: hypothetical protein [unclassified Sphingomonas]KQX18392.1 hypothetical protein ASD17_14620 [Sphingomonas sp. Root1294]KQY72283.1 hypothetical protein ASD39_20355 [Sphingomonas sp. Root50]KRB94446.1 hypothetical protein ASE22_00395 [Sphingomonas sp. Root720]